MNKKVNQLGLLVQAVLLMCFIYFVILTVFLGEFRVVSEILLSLNLFTLSYNNATIYKRKGMTFCYAFVGVLVLLYGMVM